MAKERIYPFAVASVRSMENVAADSKSCCRWQRLWMQEEALRFLQ